MPHGHDVKHTFVTLALCDLCGVDNQEFLISTSFLRKTMCLPPCPVNLKTPRPLLSNVTPQFARHHVSAAVFSAFTAPVSAPSLTLSSARRYTSARFPLS
jgi:hypothetical protein